jgi:tellurite resistance protein
VFEKQRSKVSKFEVLAPWRQRRRIKLELYENIYLLLSLLLVMLACDGIDEAHETEKLKYVVTVVGLESFNFVLIEFPEKI